MKSKQYKHFIKSAKKEVIRSTSEINYSEFKKEVSDFFKTVSESVVTIAFLNLIKYEKLKRRSFKKEIYALSLLLNISFAKNLNEDFLSKMVLLYEILEKQIELNVIEFKNLDEKIRNSIDKNSSFKDGISFESRSDVFEKVGAIFARIQASKSKELYNFGYLLSAYVFSQFATEGEKSFDEFLYEMKLNTLVIESSMKLSSKNYNDLIIKLNKYINTTKWRSVK